MLHKEKVSKEYNPYAMNHKISCCYWKTKTEERTLPQAIVTLQPKPRVVTGNDDIIATIN